MLAESLTTWTGAEIVVDYVGHNVGVVIDSVDKMSAWRRGEITIAASRCCSSNTAHMDNDTDWRLTSFEPGGVARSMPP